jgi:hypothetical protein
MGIKEQAAKKKQGDENRFVECALKTHGRSVIADKG